MHITPNDIQQLRQSSGVGIMEAKKALEAANGDLTAAMENLRKAGKKMAGAKSARTVKEGFVGSYVHANGKVAALVVLACETDFVARTDDFQQLAHDLALHIAATNPTYLQPDEIPAEVIAKEEEIYRAQLLAEGKPEAMWEKILPGKMDKFYADTCLLRQPYVKDDALTITQLLEQAVIKLGENIQIQSFSRLTV